MVTVVREAKGWSQQDLATHADLSQGYVSKIENGLLPLSGEALEVVAKVLDCPTSLLLAERRVRGIEVTCLHHRRRRSKLGASAVRKVEATAHLSRLTVEALLDGIEVGSVRALERLDDSAAGDPAGAAARMRRRWEIPPGPIEDMARLVEALGVVVVLRSLGSHAQDAVSSWPQDGVHPAVMLMNAGQSPDRERFTLAHELAHLLLHRVPGEDQEDEANKFAAAFLVPADDIEPQLRGLTTADLRRLLDLKAQWKVSIGMLIQRAKDLDCISDRQFKEFRMKLTRLGWNVNEPVDLPTETPTLLARAVSIQLSRGRSVDDLAAAALMTPAAFERHYLDSQQMSAAEQLTVVRPL